MCGINGFNFKDQEKLEEMNSKLSHRGPDFAGSFLDNEVSLGHLLLSIREIEDISKQPYLDSRDPEWVLLFNGQIYNTAQLKKELADLNSSKSDLDTYILYKIIEKCGWGFIEKTHGMFAIALYNIKEGVLRLYRDPSGQKGLYYYFKDGRFIFSSEIKSILTHDVDKTIDHDAIVIAQSLGYIPGEKTIFQHIRKIAPSQCVTFYLKEKKLEKTFYKSVVDNYFAGDFAAAFQQLVGEHLQSKQRVALNLSGGLDSSILLHEMAAQGHDMHTYTTIFPESSDKYNIDANLAKRLAKDYGADHKEIVVTKEIYKDLFIEAYKTIEEPNFNVSLPVYLKAAMEEGINGDKNRVILSGNGGDEIFGGYPHYHRAAVIGQWIKILTPWVFNSIKNYRNGTHFDYRNFNERWLFFRKLQPKSNLVLFEPVLKYLKETIAPLIEMYGHNKEDIYQMMMRERFLWMPGENFIQTDKIYMSQSAELRSPLAYHPFRLYSDKILKKKDYADKQANKLFLRKLYDGKLPDYITKRTDKTGWRSPISDWYDESFKKLFLEIIGDRKSTKHVDWDKVRQRIESSDKWPGKQVHLYLSLAILAKEYNVEI
jgi:asparagine synthase (glutamine-hydrolysing)